MSERERENPARPFANRDIFIRARRARFSRFREFRKSRGADKSRERKTGFGLGLPLGSYLRNRVPRTVLDPAAVSLRVGRSLYDLQIFREDARAIFLAADDQQLKKPPLSINPLADRTEGVAPLALASAKNKERDASERERTRAFFVLLSSL